MTTPPDPDQTALTVRSRAQVVIPDRSDPAEALARTTDLGVVAHPDDLELAMPGPILDCRDDPQRWFTGIVCTDGAGSLPPGDAPDLVATRAAEQAAAARLGRYSAVVMLGMASSEVRDTGGHVLSRVLAELLAETTPERVLTHSPLDRHDTHVAVAAATLQALTSSDHMPGQVLGCEGWGGLDWLGPEHTVALPVTDPQAALELARCFGSQLEHKAYDIAAQGRRRSNATFADPLAADTHAEVSLALDLTGAVGDPERFVAGLLADFGSEYLRRQPRGVPDRSGPPDRPGAAGP